MYSIGIVIFAEHSPVGPHNYEYKWAIVRNHPASGFDPSLSVSTSTPKYARQSSVLTLPDSPFMLLSHTYIQIILPSHDRTHVRPGVSPRLRRSKAATMPGLEYLVEVSNEYVCLLYYLTTGVLVPYYVLHLHGT